MPSFIFRSSVVFFTLARVNIFSPFTQPVLPLSGPSLRSSALQPGTPVNRTENTNRIFLIRRRSSLDPDNLSDYPKKHDEPHGERKYTGSPAAPHPLQP